MSERDERPFDLVLYGATGFSGRQAAHYLAGAAPSSLRWALAGRNMEKLAEVREELRLVGWEPPLLEADSSRPETIDAMAGQTRVVLTTAGPFARLGEPVLRACVHYGSDYADITGELPWVRDMIAKYDEEARQRGVKLVPCCGFDSVPSDLGTWMVVNWIRSTWNQPTVRVTGSYVASGGINGGTIASALGLAQHKGWEDDPELLNPPGTRSLDPSGLHDVTAPTWDPDLGKWLAPFVMAQVNTRVVRRSAGLFQTWGQGYGDDFSYQEYWEAKNRLQAGALATGLSAARAAISSKVGRAVVRALAPEPGEGPSEETMAEGFFRCRLVGEAANGRKALGVVETKGDPGNRATVKMLCEAGLALALERERLPGGSERGGFLTPATCFGEVLVERLRRAHMTWKVDRLL